MWLFCVGWIHLLLLWPLSENKTALKCQMKWGVFFLSDMLIYLCSVAEAVGCYIPSKRAIVWKWREVWKGPLHFSLSCIASKSGPLMLLIYPVEKVISQPQASLGRNPYLQNAVMLHCIPWMCRSKLCLLAHWLAASLKQGRSFGQIMCKMGRCRVYFGTKVVKNRCGRNEKGVEKCRENF